MKTTDKNVYQAPQVSRVELDSAISLTLDSSATPIGDPESMMLGVESLSSDPNGFEVL
jgi:hypothetical protein